MKIVLLGATDFVGSALLKEALASRSCLRALPDDVRDVATCVVERHSSRARAPVS